MIKVQKDGKTVRFTGKDAVWLKKTTKEWNITPQTLFTGMLWEYLMREARAGAFKNAKKAV